MKINSNAINYEYLLLEYYKKLGITDLEALILLMIEHLTKDEKSLITASNLALKMGLDEEELDVIMNNLYVKGLIDIKTDSGKLITSLEPTYSKILDCLRDTILKSAEMKENKEAESAREEVINELKDALGRDLTGLEEESVTTWISSDIDKKIIINSIKDAKQLRYVDINTIDRLIIKKMRNQDNYGNELR